MPEIVGGELAFLLEAATFSAHRHQRQKRKGIDELPYINHPLEVASLLANVGGVTDVTTLVAALLHDTIEDTPTSAEELETIFGRPVRLLVEEMTDDKRLDKAERKRLQIEHAQASSTAAKLIKLGDKIANLQELVANPPSGWPLQRRRDYLDWAERVVAGCRGVSEPLERRFDGALRTAREALAREG